MLFPYSLYGCIANFLFFGHSSGTPVGRIRRRCVSSGMDNSHNFLVTYPWNTSWPGGVFLQPSQSKSQKTFSPQLYGRTRNFKHCRNFLIFVVIGCYLNYASSLNNTKGHLFTFCPCVYCYLLFLCQYNGFCYSTHKTIIHNTLNK